ncbi:probable methyltransferase PMT26 [Tanacetum coccineum]
MVVDLLSRNRFLVHLEFISSRYLKLQKGDSLLGEIKAQLLWEFLKTLNNMRDLLEESMRSDSREGLGLGNRSRVVLDVGCGVASFGGFLFDKDVLPMSFAPKDEHEAQVQFALERGIPALSAVMGAHRLPFPGRVFDIVHCARCRVPWHIEGGKLLLESPRKSCFGVVVQTTTWIIWRYRNRICFDLKPPRKDTLGEEIKVLSHCWILHRNRKLNPLWLDWVFDPIKACKNSL